MLIRYYTLAGINPEPWEVGDLGISNRGGTKRPYMAPNPQLQAYQESVRTELRNKFGASSLTMTTTEYDLRFYFWRRLDTYTTPSGRASMRHVADATNMQKALEDALQGLLVNNDRNSRRVSSEIVAQGPGVDPGIIVVLRSPYKSLWQLELPDDIKLQFDDERDKANNLDLENFI